MNYFLVNLAICDGIICLFNVPTTLVYNEYTQVWPFGLAFCKILPGKLTMHTAKNTTDLLQAVNLTGKLFNKLQPTCQFHQVAANLLRSGSLQLFICSIVITC